MGTGIITTAVLLIFGYLIITRLIGLAFRVVIPVVLLLVLAGAGLFSGLSPDRSSAEPGELDGYGHPMAEDSRHLGDLRLRDIADGAINTARSLLRGALAFLDRSVDTRAPEPLPPYLNGGPAQRDRYDEGPLDGEPQWDGTSPHRRVY